MTITREEFDEKLTANLTAGVANSAAYMSTFSYVRALHAIDVAYVVSCVAAGLAYWYFQRKGIDVLWLITAVIVSVKAVRDAVCDHLIAVRNKIVADIMLNEMKFLLVAKRLVIEDEGATSAEG